MIVLFQLIEFGGELTHGLRASCAGQDDAFGRTWQHANQIFAPLPAVERIDPHPARHRRLFEHLVAMRYQPFRSLRARGLLAIGRHRGIEIDDHHIGARCQRLAKLALVVSRHNAAMSDNA